MKKTISKNLLIFLSLLLIISTVGCSSKNNGSANYLSDKPFTNSSESAIIATEDYNDEAYTSKAEQSVADGNSTFTENSTAADNSTALVGTGESSNALNNSILDQRKIIRNANISVEVDNFDAAYGKIEYIISNVGYVQESKISKTKHYVDNKEILITNGVIIIRVDADKFSSVLKDIKGLGLLTDENIKTDDVTEKFFDIESRLRLIRYEESRLEEYLKKIQDPDTIFKTEKRLTEIRHEIEQLTGTLNKLSNLVKLSTITINMNEKVPNSTIEPVKPTYVSKLKDNFLDSLSGVIEFLGNLLILIVAALPVLVLLGLMLLIAYFFVKKFLKNKINKPEKKSDNAEND